MTYEVNFRAIAVCSLCSKSLWKNVTLMRKGCSYLTFYKREKCKSVKKSEDYIEPCFVGMNRLIFLPNLRRIQEKIRQHQFGFFCLLDIEARYVFHRS